MRLVRFMSEEEFTKLMNGETLVNNTKHTAKTNSVGFCFMPIEDDEDDDIAHAIQFMYKFLGGIVSDDYVVVFDQIDAELFEGYGVYANPYGSFFDTMIMTEYSITQYNNQILKPIWFKKDVSHFDWLEDDEIKEINDDFVKRICVK